MFGACASSSLETFDWDLLRLALVLGSIKLVNSMAFIVVY